MTVEELKKRLDAIGVPDDLYSLLIGGFPNCPTAHYWRRNPQIIFDGFPTPIVRYFSRPQVDSGGTADCCSFISGNALRFLK